MQLKRHQAASILAALLLPWLVLACGPSAEKTTPDIAEADAPASSSSLSDEAAPFVDRTADSGLDFVHWTGRTGDYFYSEMMGAGAALFDVDRDGDLDLLLVQGSALGPAAESVVPIPAHGLGDRLYRNDLESADDGSRSIRFVDITEASGLAAIETGYGMGVAIFDADANGWPDVYLTRSGANVLLHHRGLVDGVPRFEDATGEASAIRRWSVPAVPFDADLDGDLDLFVGNYVRYSTARDKRCSDELGQRNYCGPLTYPAQPDSLLINQWVERGELAFEERSGVAGMSAAYGACLGAAVVDIDLDGRLDIYVANDGTANQLWRNLGDGRFEDQALERGLAVGGQGQPQASMGVAVGDTDLDGEEDIFVTHLTGEPSTLYVHAEHGGFIDRSAESGLGAATFDRTGFGTGFLDFDHDGVLDLVMVSGAVKVIKEQVLAGDEYPLKQPNQLFRGRGDGRLEDISKRAGEPFRLSDVSRGVVLGDIDNDGDIDLVVTNNGGPARLLINRVGQDTPWLGLRLLDEHGLDVPAAVAVVELADGRRLLRRQGANASYASSSDPRLHFGLGPDAVVLSVDVHWPGGETERFESPPVGVYTELRRGSGTAVTSSSTPAVTSQRYSVTSKDSGDTP